MFSYTSSTGMRLKDWKMKPRVLWRKVGQRLILQRPCLGAVDLDDARGRRVDAADHVEDGGLAGARGSGDRDKLSFFDRKGDAAHGVHLGLPQGVDLGHIDQLDNHLSVTHDFCPTFVESQSCRRPYAFPADFPVHVIIAISWRRE